MTQQLYPNRQLRICHLNVEPTTVDAPTLVLEKHLQHLGTVEIVPIQSLDDDKFFPCDVLVVAAQRIPEEAFAQWLQRFTKKMHSQGRIWVPALIFANISFMTLRSGLIAAMKENWYFDIIAPQHINSLPIRVANLLRIHDHLHELKRYSETLDQLTTTVKGLSEDLSRLRGNH